MGRLWLQSTNAGTLTSYLTTLVPLRNRNLRQKLRLERALVSVRACVRVIYVLRVKKGNHPFNGFYSCMNYDCYTAIIFRDF